MITYISATDPIKTMHLISHVISSTYSAFTFYLELNIRIHDRHPVKDILYRYIIWILCRSAEQTIINIDEQTILI